MSKKTLQKEWDNSEELRNEFETFNMYLLYVTGGDFSQLTD